jgi:hypothetical protein
MPSKVHYSPKNTTLRATGEKKSRRQSIQQDCEIVQTLHSFVHLFAMEDRVLEKLNRATHLDKLCSSWDMLAELDTIYLQTTNCVYVNVGAASKSRGLPEKGVIDRSRRVVNNKHLTSTSQAGAPGINNFDFKQDDGGKFAVVLKNK